MIFYHGSNLIVREVDLGKCRPFKDFGRGFYLTNIKEQAEQMAARVVRLYGGHPCVSRFEADREKLTAASEVNFLRFEKPSRDWALFIINNRDRYFKDVRNRLCNQDNKYDVVYGAVANDDIAHLFRIFRSGLIDIDALVRGLEFKTLTNQYSFHTERALKYLKFVEAR